MIVINHSIASSWARTFLKSDLMVPENVCLQWVKCTFTVHINDIALAGANGSSLVMLRPGGHLDMDYLSRSIQQHCVTSIFTVPVLAGLLSEFLNTLNQNDTEKRLQSLLVVALTGKFRKKRKTSLGFLNFN